ncbi:MAG: FtsX-like permease family protein [Bdellovibrio sp.]
MIGISISVTAFLVVLFIMNGMNANIKKRIIGLEPHLYVEIPTMTQATALESHPAFQRLRENSEDRVYVYETQDVIIRSQDGQFRGGVARGVNKESLGHFVEQLQRMEEGKKNSGEAYFWDPADVPGTSEIMMGVDLAQSLGVYEGDYVTLISPAGLLLPPGETPKFERVKIKRILATSLAEVDAQMIFYQRDEALNALDQEGTKRMGIEVWLHDEGKLNEVKKSLVNFDDVKVETWMDRNSALLYALKLEKMTIGTFLGLAGMIAGSSILTVLALLLSQKKSDIAILRAMGFSARQTVLTFTQIGFILASIGVVSGLIIGTSVSLYIQANPLQLTKSQIYYDPSIPALVDGTLLLSVVVVSMAIAWLGSYIPARTAAEMEPSEALRIK